MPAPILQFKRGSAAAGVGTVPALRPGEPAFSTNFFDLFVGFDTSVDGNKFFGSHRYWKREDGVDSLELRLVNEDGDNSIGLRAPIGLDNSDTLYTLPELGDTGHYLRLGTSGVLEWASVSEGATFDDATFTGITTFSGLIDAQAGLGVTGGSTFDDINVTGVGTINHLEYNSSTTTGISTVGELYIGETRVLHSDDNLVTLAGIQTADATTIATLEALLALDPNDFSSLNIAGISTFQEIAYFEEGIDVNGLADFEDVNVSGFATFTNAIDADILGNAGTATSLSDLRDFSVSGDVETSAAVSFDGTGNVDLAVTLSSTFSANTSGIITATGGFVGDLTGNADTATSADTVDTTGTSDNVSYYIPFVANSSSTTGETVRVGTGISFNPSTNTLTVANVETGAVKAEDGTAAITISDATGNVSFASTVTITGDLQVLGSTTTVNTETLLVKDPVIDIGLINVDGDLVEPTAPTATDLALVFHYYDSSAKQSSLYWDHDNANGERFILASDLTGHTVGTATTSVEASAYAALEVGTLWINNACSDGAQEVIGCNGNSELALMNIVVDAGEF
jgi:hypothetical protein